MPRMDQPSGPLPLPAIQAVAAAVVADGRAADGWTRVVCLARVFLFATFMTVSATIPLLRRDFGVSAAEAGGLASAFTVAYALSMFLFGWAGDRIGAKRATVIGAVGSALASVLFGLFARDYVSALVLYGLIGLNQGG